MDIGMELETQISLTWYTHWSWPHGTVAMHKGRVVQGTVLITLWTERLPMQKTTILMLNAHLGGMKGTNISATKTGPQNVQKNLHTVL